MIEPRTRHVLVCGPRLQARHRRPAREPGRALVERLLGDGCEVRVFDPDVRTSHLMGINLAYIRDHLPHFEGSVRRQPGRIACLADTAVVTYRCPEFTAALGELPAGTPLVDLAGGFRNRPHIVASPASVLILVENLPSPSTGASGWKPPRCMLRATRWPWSARRARASPPSARSSTASGDLPLLARDRGRQRRGLHHRILAGACPGLRLCRKAYRAAPLRRDPPVQPARRALFLIALWFQGRARRARGLSTNTTPRPRCTFRQVRTTAVVRF